MSYTPPTLDINERIFRHLRIDGECWVWEGSGAPSQPALGMADGSQLYVRRHLYASVHGALDSYQFVRVNCDRPACVNPEHQTTELSTKQHEARTLRRLWKYVTRGAGCWLWTGAVSHNGYGKLWTGTATVPAHRYSYTLHTGAIPDGLSVLHRCDTPACVNPEHLFLGTHTDNMADMVQKRRQYRTAPRPSIPGATTGSVWIRGSKNGNARLTDEKVVELRALHGEGWTQRELAERFGMDQTTISDVARRKTWKHIP